MMLDTYIKYLVAFSLTIACLMFFIVFLFITVEVIGILL